MHFRNIFVKNLPNFLILTLLIFLQTTLSKAMLEDEDTIDFFNVGQGHAVLVNKVGAVPLLIDAGSLSRPSTVSKGYEWASQDPDSLATQICERILESWKFSNRGTLIGKKFHLNVIITHPDEDHKDFIPLILTKLESKKVPFSSKFLLGGKPSQYSGFLDKYHKKIRYSKDFEGILYPQNNLKKLEFLNRSQCISHLFCPKGLTTDTATARNRWSIITRIELSRMSALFAGDADKGAKKQMLAALRGRETELETDILLVPHHGAEKTYHDRWDQLVNPKIIIIGAGLNYKYNHPRGETLLELLRLKQGKGRLWNNKVMPHGLQYYCEDNVQEEIAASFLQHGNKLLELVPNLSAENQAEELQKRWYLAWIDLPIYTLWTTGNLRFEKGLCSPTFIEAPHGLMNYIAVPDPKYLFAPHRRERLLPISKEENEELQKILTLIPRKYQTEKIEELGVSYSNILVKELYLIDKPADREVYLYALSKIFAEIAPLQYLPAFSAMCKTPSFQWLREAITGKSSEAHIKRGIDFLFRSSETLDREGEDDLSGDMDLNVGLCDENLEGLTYILKTFSKSYHPPEYLRNYIRGLSNILYHGFSLTDLDVLCPFGFPEWLQLGKLGNFGHALLWPDPPYDDSPAPPDAAEIFRTLPLRLEGKTFKEIAKNLIEDEEFIRYSLELLEQDPEEFEGLPMQREEMQKTLEKYFPSSADDFLS